MLNKKGFTLIEVVVVTLIIAALALLVAPSFKNSTVTNQMEKAKIGLVELNNAVKLFREVNPSQAESLTGVFDAAKWALLSNANDPEGFMYLQAPNRWAQKGSPSQYSLVDGGTVLNCKYTINTVSENTMIFTNCAFDRADDDGRECFKFFIQKTNPAVVKKERLDGCEGI